MTTIPRLGKYVNDEIAYELHKLKTDEIIREYYEIYSVRKNLLYKLVWTYDWTFVKRAINFRKDKSLYPTILTYESKSIGNFPKLKYPHKLPKKYWYTSGLSNPNAYKNKN